MKLLRIKEVCERIGVKSPEVVWGRLREGHENYDPEFPKPVKVSKGITAWVEHEVDAYIEKLIARRDAEMVGK